MISLWSASELKGIYIAAVASSASRALFACWEARAAPERTCLLAIFSLSWLAEPFRKQTGGISYRTTKRNSKINSGEDQQNKANHENILHFPYENYAILFPAY
jgi:hypothetical protein